MTRMMRTMKMIEKKTRLKKSINQTTKMKNAKTAWTKKATKTGIDRHGVSGITQTLRHFGLLGGQIIYRANMDTAGHLREVPPGLLLIDRDVQCNFSHAIHCGE